MLEKNIFDLKELSDLPKDMKEILANKTVCYGHHIMHLFSIKNQLSVDEIMVALYRQYGVDKTSNNIRVALYSLIKNKKLKRIGKGLFELIQ